MNTHQIGIELRAQVLRDRKSGRQLDPRRLQAWVADLCSDDQQELIAPLCHLVFSRTFATATCLDRPLTDERFLQLLFKDLSEEFTPALCTRMRPVIEGLMGMDMPATSKQWSATHPVLTSSSAARGSGVGVASPSAKIAKKLNTNAVLAFLIGVLLMTLAGVGFLVWQRQSNLALAIPDISSSSRQSASGMSTDPAVPRAVPGQPELPATSPEEFGNVSRTDRALRSIQELYSALSAKEFEKSTLFYGSGASDQFTPGFFRRFKRVSVRNLQVISETGSTVNLEGVVTFVWPDRSLQSEMRYFSVDTSRELAQISTSEFGRVILPRH